MVPLATFHAPVDDDRAYATIAWMVGPLRSHVRVVQFSELVCHTTVMLIDHVMSRSVFACEKAGSIAPLKAVL